MLETKTEKVLKRDDRHTGAPATGPQGTDVTRVAPSERARDTGSYDLGCAAEIVLTLCSP